MKRALKIEIMTAIHSYDVAVSKVERAFPDDENARKVLIGALAFAAECGYFNKRNMTLFPDWRPTESEESKEINDKINGMFESYKANARAGAFRIRVTCDDDTVEEFEQE